jgi:threonine dehydrogenase-like Zn-dependent dehydrogenase
MRLLAQGLRPTRIVSHRFPLAEWQQGFALFERKEAAKVLLRP